MNAAALAAWRDWQSFSTSKTPLDQAAAINRLQNSMFDLATWLPGFDNEMGDVPEELEDLSA